MLIAVLGAATVLGAIWLVLLGMVSEEDWVEAAFNAVLDNRMEIDRLQSRDAANAKILEQYRGAAAKVMGLFLESDSQKKIDALNRKNDALQRGNLRAVRLLDMPGYVLQRRIDAIGRGAVHKAIMEKSIELYGKKYAEKKCRQLLAQMLSYPIIGVSLSLALGALLVALGIQTPGFAVMVVGTALVLVLVYALYDELGDRLNKRRADISRQFPNVVSKLALLVTSGMIVDRAWRETAQSQELGLYQEMRKTSDELANLVEPATAYANFIDRCNTKETTKLASAIIQSVSKGNAEIGALLKGMAHEAWQERRHTAKRDSEAANSKLMIPTMLLFLAILVLIMVPIAINFGGLT